MVSDDLGLLRLLQLADSALPIGTTAHSFGLETLAAEGILRVEHLQSFLRDHLVEIGVLEGSFCCAAHRLAASTFFTEDWLDLNRRLSALKPARENRVASATLGRRLLQFTSEFGRWPVLDEALRSAKEADVHHSAAFGLVGGLLGFDEQTTVLAYLHQSLAGFVSACQRLMPLGQSRASRILWDLKPDLIATTISSQYGARNLDEIACFTPLVDLGSMRHTALATRLFIS